MIDKQYGLGAEQDTSSNFETNLFSTKEIDLEGRYINIANLNYILKRILDTLYDYYKGRVLDYVEGNVYDPQAVVRFQNDLYLVLEQTDANPLDAPKKYKLCTPNVEQMIEEARANLQSNIDHVQSNLEAEAGVRANYDDDLRTLINANTERLSVMISETDDEFEQIQNDFSVIREQLRQHGIINDQEDTYISQLQQLIRDIQARDSRQDVDLMNLKNITDNHGDLITNLSGTLDDTISRVTANEGNINDLMLKAQTFESDIYRLYTKTNTLSDSLDQYKESNDSRSSVIESDIVDLNNKVNENSVKIDGLQIDISNLNDNLDNFKTQTTEYNDNNDAKLKKLEDYITDVDTKNEVYNNNSILKEAELQTELDKLADDFNAYQSTSDPRLDRLETLTSSHAERIDNLEGRMDSKDNEVQDLQDYDLHLLSMLENLEENVGTNNSIITDIQDRLEDLRNTTSENNTTLVQVTDDHTTDISQIKEVNNTQDTRLEALENKLASGGLSDVALQQLRTTLKNDIDTAAENTKKGLYEEITGTGKEGEYLRLKYSETNGRNEVESTPLITFAKIATNQEQVDALKLEPVGMSTVFNTWYRFSHWRNEQNISGNTGHDMGGHMGDCPNNWSGWEHETARNKWSYNPSNKMICSNRNSPVYGAFVSPRKLANWYLKLLAYGGGDGDNDGILINLAYMKGEDGVEHTIDLVRAVMGKGNGIYLDNIQMRHQWSIVYDYNMTTEFELATNTYIQPKSGGWGTQYCCFSAQRTKTNFKCYTSQIGGRVETVDPKSEINWTLPLTKPSNYSDAMYANLKIMMENPAQMGVGAHSQNGLFTILDQKYIFDDEKIYDFVSNNIWEYDEPTRLWNSVGKCSDMFDGFVYSRITEDLYYIDNGKVINVNNASTLVTETRVQELIEQLATEVQERDTETLTSSKDYTDSKVQERLQELTTSAEFTELKARVKSLEDENTELKNRVRTLEDYMSNMEIKDVEVDGETYTLVVAKEEQENVIPQIERLNTKIFDFTLESNGVKEFTKEDLNLKDITDLGYSVYVKNIDETSAYYGKYTTAELLSDNYMDDEKVVIINTSKFTLDFKVVFRRQ